MTQRKVMVQGHTRKDGSYVAPHTRTVKGGASRERADQVRDSLGTPPGAEEPERGLEEAPRVSRMTRLRRLFEGKSARAEREAREQELARQKAEEREEAALEEKYKRQREKFKEDVEAAAKALEEKWAERDAQAERALEEKKRREQEAKDSPVPPSGTTTDDHSRKQNPAPEYTYHSGDAFNYEGAGDLKYTRRRGRASINYEGSS